MRRRKSSTNCKAQGMEVDILVDNAGHGFHGKWWELPIEVFLAGHPKALEFVQTPKPSPSSFARESYFGVTAMRFTNKDGVSRYGRYRIIPDAGKEHLDDATVKTKDANYLFDELTERIARGPIGFQILV